MSTYRTFSTSRLSDKDTVFSAYKSYKQITFGNKILEKKLHPNNLILDHYKPYNFPNKKSNRSGWLDKQKLYNSQIQELDGNMFKRKIKPDQVSFVIEMKFDLNNTSIKERSRNALSKPKEINTQRTIIPQKNV